MNCKQVKRLAKYSVPPLSDAWHENLESHVHSCSDCRRELAVDRLISVLMTSHSDAVPEESHWDKVRMINGIKARIQEANDQGAGSWDIAIIAVRGWLVAFGAAAILLLILSNQLATTRPLDMNDRELISQSASVWSEEIVSNNSPSPSILGEEPEHAH